MTKTSFATCVGPTISDTLNWCNRHLHTFIAGKPNRFDIVLDTEHPMFGTLATLQYPSDSYPFVVIGGSKSGKTLVFAPVEVPNRRMGNRLTVTRDDALAFCKPAAARVLRQSKARPDRYGDNMYVAGRGQPFAYFYLSPEV